MKSAQQIFFVSESLLLSSGLGFAFSGRGCVAVKVAAAAVAVGVYALDPWYDGGWGYGHHWHGGGWAHPYRR